MRKARQTDGQTGMTKLIFAFGSFANAPTIFSPLYSVHEYAVHTGRHELTPDVSILQFLAANKNDVFNGIRADTWRFRDARHSQMASHTASHCLHGVIRRTALLSSDLTVTEHTTNVASVTVQLTASVVWWLACWPLVPEFAGSIPTEAVGWEKNPQHAFLRRGSKIICPMTQL
jgi:hypothetical protein